MKKLLIILGLCPLFLFAQTIVSSPQLFQKYITVKDSAAISGRLRIPGDTTLNKWGIAQIGQKFYLGNGAYWSFSNGDYVSKTISDTILARKKFTKRVFMDSMYGAIYDGVLYNSLIRNNLGFSKAGGGVVRSYLAASETATEGISTFRLPSRLGNDTLLCQGDSDLYITPTQFASKSQIQSDWTQSDDTQVDFIKNKPDLNELSYLEIGQSPSTVVLENSTNPLIVTQPNLQLRAKYDYGDMFNFSLDNLGNAVLNSGVLGDLPLEIKSQNWKITDNGTIQAGLESDGITPAIGGFGINTDTFDFGRLKALNILPDGEGIYQRQSPLIKAEYLDDNGVIYLRNVNDYSIATFKPTNIELKERVTPESSSFININADSDANSFYLSIFERDEVNESNNLIFGIDGYDLNFRNNTFRATSTGFRYVSSQNASTVYELNFPNSGDVYQFDLPAINGYNSATILTDKSPFASASVNGILSSSNWTTFNNKQSALVSGTNIKTINGNSLLGSGDLSITTSPAGSNNQIQFNNSGSLGASSNFVYNNSTDVLELGSSLVNSGILSKTASSFNISNSNSTARMNFGLMSGSASTGSEIFGSYFSVFGNNTADLTQRGSAEFVFDTRNVGTGASGFNITSFDGTNWDRMFRILSPTGRVLSSPNSSKITVSSGSFNSFSITPSITTSGTAGYRGLFISPFEQSIGGSGPKYIADFGINSAANGSGTHTSRMLLTSDGNLGIGITAPAALLHTYGSVATPIVAERSTQANVTLQFKQSTFSGWIGLDGAGNFGVSRTSADLGNFSDMLRIDRSSGKLNLRTGSNTSVGTASFSSGTVVVNNSSVTSSSIIHVTMVGTPGSQVGVPYVVSKISGTSFTVSCYKSTGAIETGCNDSFTYQIIN